MSDAKRRIAKPGTCVVLGLALVGSGCGSKADYANNPRAPAPIVVTAAISGNRIAISPATFGAGPIELIVTNLTNVSQQLTLETNEINGPGAGIRQQTGPINPQDTASLKASVRQGTYSIHVDNKNIQPAALQVSAQRTSAQNLLLQP